MLGTLYMADVLVTVGLLLGAAGCALAAYALRPRGMGQGAAGAPGGRPAPCPSPESLDARLWTAWGWES